MIQVKTSLYYGNFTIKKDTKKVWCKRLYTNIDKYYVTYLSVGQLVVDKPYQMQCQNLRVQSYYEKNDHSKDFFQLNSISKVVLRISIGQSNNESTENEKTINNIQKQIILQYTMLHYYI